ncbi:hypothetical protein H2248_010741 [Termitomyces sp. 'cryptogamus']|nr:hypothetical protein H2248_010741 [Termitomyces sp. 'cryptogamus']
MVIVVNVLVVTFCCRGRYSMSVCDLLFAIQSSFLSLALVFFFLFLSFLYFQFFWGLLVRTYMAYVMLEPIKMIDFFGRVSCGHYRARLCLRQSLHRLYPSTAPAPKAWLITSGLSALLSSPRQ